jgi:hypothetical protein
VLVADLPDRVHVRERDRLTADEVRACLEAHEGDLVDAMLRDQGLELGDVEVALERVLVRRLEGDVVRRSGVKGTGWGWRLARSRMAPLQT